MRPSNEPEHSVAADPDRTVSRIGAPPEAGRRPSASASTIGAGSPPAVGAGARSPAAGPGSFRPTGRIGNGYEIRDELGHGGMGIVHLAVDRSLRREVAYKIVRTGRATPLAVERLIHEAQVTGQLEHPNIIPVYALGQTAAGEPFFTMKRVRGATLLDRLDDARIALAKGDDPWTAFSLAARIDVMRKVLDALGVAHEAGVIHRDLKPTNIMVGKHGEVLLMDWGLARIIGTPVEPDDAAGAISTDRQRDPSSRTQMGTVVGTPAYMSPEQAGGRIEQLDARSDLFSAGALLYELLTLSAPYRGATAADIMAQALRATAEPPGVVARRIQGGYARRIPPDLIAITQRAMSRDPADRYESAAAMRADIDAWSESRLISARPRTLPGAMVRWTRRHPATVVTLAITTALLLVIGQIAVQLRLSRSQRAEADNRAEAEAARAAEAEADRRAAAAEAERNATEAARNAAEARMANAAAAMTRGQLAEARAILGATAESYRDQTIRHYNVLWDVLHRTGISSDRFMEIIGRDRLAVYKDAFDNLIDEVAPNDPTVTATGDDYGMRATIHHLYGDLDAALADADEAVRLAPDLTAAYYVRGRIRVDRGEPAAALADFTRMLQLDPDSVRGYKARAIAHGDLGRTDDALADLNEALKRVPADAEALAVRGAMLARVGRHADALRDLDAALELRPNQAHTLATRGNLHAVAGRLDDAYRDFSAAIGIDPRSGAAFAGRGHVRLLRRNLPGALSDLDTALALRTRSIPLPF
jgi:serine/threonine protein kinase/Flp pilus assembly protein TadD